MYKNKPVVTDIANTLQENERKSIREEYIAGQMNIHPSTIDQIDQYALGRVFPKNKAQSAFYAKIIHKQFNTMEVNHKWKLGSDICPLCNKHKEDWLHTLQCTAPAQISHRDLCLADLELKLKQYKTYPPLADFIYETVANQNLQPEDPNIINPKYTYMHSKKHINLR